MKVTPIKTCFNEEITITSQSSWKIKNSPDDEEVYDTNTDEINDQYLGIKVVSSRYDSTQEGTVIRRKHYSDGTLFRTKNTNPILNTRV